MKGDGEVGKSFNYSAIRHLALYEGNIQKLFLSKLRSYFYIFDIWPRHNKISRFCNMHYFWQHSVCLLLGANLNIESFNWNGEISHKCQVLYATGCKQLLENWFVTFLFWFKTPPKIFWQLFSNWPWPCWPSWIDMARI